MQVAQDRVEWWDLVNTVMNSMKYCLQEWYGQFPVDKTALRLEKNAP
jgi:hypothetical protein